MSRNPWQVLALVVVLAASIGACEDDNPITPRNHGPVNHSLTAFPTAIRQGESTLITCITTDADGDALVYDWLTDSRLIIKGNGNYSELYGSPSNSQVFYHGPPSPFDSAWIECAVRDGKGGFAPRMVHIRINQ